MTQTPGWITGCFLLLAMLCLGSPLPVTAGPAARLLLTFDDGPSTRADNNPTETILQVLADNEVQDGIRAIFFVQTRNGPDPRGQRTWQLLHQIEAEGHVLGVHEGRLRRAKTHTGLEGDALTRFLVEASRDLRQLTGSPPNLVRPPYWAFDERTRAAYRDEGMKMLLTDVSVGDGKSWGFRANPRRRGHLRNEMASVRKRIDAGAIQPVDGLLPIIVTLHDTNTWTASHMEEYLALLVRSAEAAGIKVDSQAYYTSTTRLRHAALERARDESNPIAQVPTLWRWLWF